ncbi:hypothetical protein SAMN05421748_102329 [Paractinoplanes atraurantiacus]|uniref:Uncharacterized protein n=1 Tax=Paractinoplanes atraurantiacus TaxID=1036182 RepID=A0A285GPM4_9ACTN|nr:hypothetical protein SAMN05421748_102329 [Actinoplanes atraurantiacus]
MTCVGFNVSGTLHPRRWRVLMWQFYLVMWMEVHLS